MNKEIYLRILFSISESVVDIGIWEPFTRFSFILYNQDRLKSVFGWDIDKTLERDAGYLLEHLNYLFGGQQ